MDITVLRIQELQSETKYTVRELAEIAGCSKSAIQRYTSGACAIPTSVIKGFAKAYNVHPAYLLGWVDDRFYTLEDKTKQPTQGEPSVRKQKFIDKILGMSDAELDRLEQILDLIAPKDE